MKRYLMQLFSWRTYFSGKESISLLILLLIGFVLRVVNAIGTQLWRDEIYIITTSGANSFWNLLIQNHWDTAHPPLYFLFLHIWEKFGWGDLYFRLPSLVCAFFILYLVPVLVVKLYKNEKGLPFIALFFFSFSHTQISLSMVARPYPFVLLGILISLILFLDIDVSVDKRNMFVKTILFAVVTVVTFLTDYAAAWLVLGYWVYWIFRFIRGKGKKIWTGSALVLTSALCLLWTPVFLQGLSKALSLEKHLGAYFVGTNPFLANVWQLAFFVGASDYNAPFLFNKYVYQAWYIILFFLSVIGILLSIKKYPKQTLFGFIFILAPLSVSFVFSMFSSPIFQYRNLLIINIFTLIGMSQLVYVLFKTNTLTLPVVILLWVYVFFCAFPFLHFVDPPRDWVQVARIIAPRQRKVLIITETKDKSMYDTLYYFAGYRDRKLLKVRTVETMPKTIPADTVVYLSYISFKRKTQTKITKGIADISEHIGCRSLYEYSVNWIYLARCER